MPNHVTNIIIIHAEGDRLREILDTIKDDKVGIHSIDFNKLIPMPESLDIECSSKTDNGIKQYLTALNPATGYFVDGVDKMDADAFGSLLNQLNISNFYYRPFNGELSPADIAAIEANNGPNGLLSIGKTALENHANYGATDWYEWCCRNWGTKWNAYNFETCTDGNTLRFNTAWSCPAPVVRALSEKYPDVQIEVKWADEDIGTNVGNAIYLGGEMTEILLLAAHSTEAYKMAFDITGYYPEDYGLEFDEESGEYRAIKEDGMEMK